MSIGSGDILVTDVQTDRQPDRQTDRQTNKQMQAKTSSPARKAGDNNITQHNVAFNEIVSPAILTPLHL